MKTFSALIIFALTLAPAVRSHAGHEGKIQILLLGDSTTEASFPKKFTPKEPQFEEVIRLLLAAERDLPPANVMNEALLWLLSDESNGVSGHRFVGNLWDTSLAPSDAARGAMQPVVALPTIL